MPTFLQIPNDKVKHFHTQCPDQINLLLLHAVDNLANFWPVIPIFSHMHLAVICQHRDNWTSNQTRNATNAFNGLFSRTTCISQYQKGKTSLDLNEARDDEVLECSGISWTVCKQSAPRSRQITTPTPRHWFFYRPDALPDTQPAVSQHWRLTQNATKIATSWNIFIKINDKLLGSIESGAGLI